MSEKYDVLIVGAGLSGLATAGYLAKAGKKVKIVEKNPLPGGSTISPVINGCLVSQLAPICPSPAYDNPSGWAKLAKDFEADVQVKPSEVSRVYIRGKDKDYDFKIMLHLSPKGAANWMVHTLLASIRPELISDKTDEDMYKIIKEIYEASLDTLGTEWGEMSLEDWLPQRSTDPGVKFALTAMLSGTIFTGDHEYTYKYASAGKGLLLLRMWLGAGGCMVVPKQSPQAGISQPIADAVEGMGVEIEYNVDVQQVLIEEGKVTGILVKKGEEEETLTAEQYVIATRWGTWPVIFKPMPDFMAPLIAEVMKPEHVIASAFKTFFLDDEIKLDPSFFMLLDGEGDGSHVLGGYAQSVEQPWNTVPGTQFIWAYRIMTNATFEQLGQEAVEKQIHEDMERLYPGFHEHLKSETPFGGRVAPSHYFYNKQKKLQHHYDSISNLYFAGDCTTPMPGMLTDGAAATGEIVANLMLN